MRLSDAGVAFIARWEGSVDHWYRDALGNWTIGIGHFGDPSVEFTDVAADGLRPGRWLSEAQIADLFRSDVAPYAAVVDRMVTVPLTQRQFDALVDFAFNWGIGTGAGFPSTSVLRLVNAGDFAAMASELVDGHGPTGRPYDKGLEGVRARRIAEAEAFRMTPVDIIRAAMVDVEAEGVPVAWVDGWEDRGRPYAFNPQGAVDHHTATAGYDYDYPSLGIVRDGRSDLPGPLAQFGIGRHTGTVYVIAGGYANHAGGGGWAGLTGNGSVWAASEAENDGVGEPISPLQTKARLALHAALARHTGYDADMICCHREWSDGGKIDPTGVDGDWLRSTVAARLAGGPTDPPHHEEEDMPFNVTIRPGEQALFGVPVVEGGAGVKWANLTITAPDPTGGGSGATLTLAHVWPSERKIDAVLGRPFSGRVEVQLQAGDQAIEIINDPKSAARIDVLVESGK